jgi:hypothetical protein
MTEPEFPTSYSAGWLAGGTSWLPAASQEQIAREEVRDRRAAGEAEAARAEALELAEFKAQREGRDTSLQGVWDRAQRSARKTDYQAEKAELAERIQAGEITVLDGQPVSRAQAQHPGSDYEIDSVLARANDLHRDLVSFCGRRDYPGAMAAARAKSEAGRDRPCTAAANPGRAVNPGAVARGWCREDGEILR